MNSVKDSYSILVAADQAVSSSKFKTAVRKYIEYEKLVEPKADLLLKIAEVCEKADDDWRAIEYYEQASKLVPDEPAPLMAIARICNSMLKHDRALQALDAALTIGSPDKPILLQLLFTLREISVTTHGVLSPEEAHQRLIQAATTLIEVDPLCCKAYCYRALGRMRLNSQDMEGARCDLDTASKIDTDEPLAQYFRALLHIEAGEFLPAFNLLECAYERFQKDGSKNYCSEISSIYHHYRDKEIWAKRQRHRGMLIEQQMDVFRDCGIGIVQHANPEAITSERWNREHFEIADPFHNLLIALVNAELVSNGVHFDTECIYNTGDYARFVAIFRDLAMGDFPATDICDHVTQGDEDLSAQLWLSFSLDGKKFKWKPRYNNDWLDLSILRKLSNLVAKRKSGNCFVLVPTAVDTSDYLLLYLSVEQIARLRNETGIVLETL